MAFPFPWTDGEPLRFDKFMERALHDPARGYYARRIRAVGRGGDFTTTPMLSSALARAIADWAGKGGRDLIEIGPGEGKLAAEVLRALPWWKRWRTRLHLVESSAALRGKQQARLGKKARWHATMQEALASCGGGAFIYSNELIDAFPARRFRKTETGWDELFLLPGPPPAESWQPAEDPPPSTSFEIPHPPGQIIEVHESVGIWLKGWMPGWRSGAMLIIDYGDAAESLYHRRPHGTLRAYFLQQRLEGPAVYQNAGRQDLTADVNFSDWKIWWPGEHSIALPLITQREFLLPHIDPANRADASLIDPEGAGSAFKVLQVIANIED